jgi:hypothetical protein
VKRSVRGLVWLGSWWVTFGLVVNLGFSKGGLVLAVWEANDVHFVMRVVFGHESIVCFAAEYSMARF